MLVYSIVLLLYARHFIALMGYNNTHNANIDSIDNIDATDVIDAIDNIHY